MRSLRSGIVGSIRRGTGWIVALLLAVAVRLGRWITIFRLRFARPRSLWGITPILTLRPKTEADRLLGLRAVSMVFVTYHISRDFDINLQKQSRFLLDRFPWLYETYQRLLLVRALLQYDVFHYFNDRGILDPDAENRGIRVEELTLLRRAGKRIYTYAYGADVRTRQRTLALGRFNFCVDCPEVGRFCICDDGAGDRNMRRIARYANAMLAMGDMLAYVPGARNTYYWPLDIARMPYVGVAASQDRPLKIVHAPNHPHFKGTRYLIEVIERLHREGASIEFVLIQNLSNEEAKRHYAEADVVAEQFIGGFHGYTALEAMAAGKPVIAYLRSPDLALAPEDCPIINATPDNLYETLKHYVNNPEELRVIGRRGRNYVLKHYSIAAFAARLGRLYLDTANFPAHLNRKLRARVDELEREHRAQ